MNRCLIFRLFLDFLDLLKMIQLDPHKELSLSPFLNASPVVLGYEYTQNLVGDQWSSLKSRLRMRPIL